MAVKAKRQGLELDVRTFEGRDGESYIVFRTAAGAFHAFREIEAKEAARQCGAQDVGNTRKMWKSIWAGSKSR